MANLSTLIDTFDDNSIDGALWPGNYGTVAEMGGRARLTCDTSFNAYVSASSYSFDSFFLRAFPAAQNGAGVTAYLSIFLASAGQPAGTNVGFSYDAVSGQLSLINWVGFSDAGLVALTYNATSHAWLRCAASGGNLVWQTSPDGSTWTTQRTVSTPAWLAAAADVKIFMESHRDSGSANFCEIDNFNVLPAVIVNATGAAALGGLTTTGTAVRTTPATGTATPGGLAAAAIGIRTAPGTAAATLGALTAAAPGDRLAPAVGVATLGGLTVAAGGARTVEVAAAATLGSLVAASTGLRTVAGTTAATLGALSASASAESSTTRRPDGGATVRPHAGTTARAGAGTTARPSSGTTTRPYVGVTSRR